jgi:hypothetical protein
VKHPPCKWYVSVETPECGKEAPYRVKVKTKVTTATVDLCEEHKAVHDRAFAQIRAEREAANRH